MSLFMKIVFIFSVGMNFIQAILIGYFVGQKEAKK